MEALKFNAEMKEVKASKLASNDMGARLVLLTDEMTVLSLGMLPADALLKVTVEVAE